MNKVYLFGKVIYKSNLKYEVYPKLKLHMDIEINTSEGNCFKCKIPERLCDKFNNIKLENYIYI